MRSDDFSSGCPGLKSLADDYYAALDNYNNLLKDKKILEGPSDSKKCKITTADSASKIFDKKDELSIKCLIDVEASCEAALNAAQDRYDTIVENQKKTWCPTCNANQQGTACSYGGTCSSGLSKAAQFGLAWGGPIASVANGFMNMLSYNKGINACVSSNASLIAAQQSQNNALIAAQTAQSDTTLALYKAVGLSGPTNPITAAALTGGGCGTGGFGMGGFGGVGGMPGMGGYNPYGGMGMGMQSPFGMGMQSPFGLQAGMQSPFGMQAGMQSPFGMQGGGGYSPFGGQQNQYGLNSGLYGNNMYQQQANMSSVAQQMGMQNQLINQSAYSQNPFMQGGYQQPNMYMQQQAYPGYNGYNNGYNNGYAGLSGGFNLQLPSINFGIGQQGQYSNPWYMQQQQGSCGYYTAGVPCAGY